MNTNEQLEDDKVIHVKKVEGESRIIPVHEESIEVAIKTVETGSVQLNKRIATEAVHLSIPLNFNEIDVERIPKNIELEEMPTTRQEGNKTIIPVVKEVAVVVKKLLLVEELVITNKQQEYTDTYETTLHSEFIEVQRKE